MSVIECIRKKIKNDFYYYTFFLIAIIYPISQYPNIYGVDTFGYIWMAQTIREGALFSKTTWLIHPLMVFGFYPITYAPIGIPIILALLISMVVLLSFGIYGIPEAVLIYNIIIIYLILRSTWNLGNKLFKEKGILYIFVAGILFSSHLMRETMMIVSTRIIIVIIMINILNIGIKLINEVEKANQTKNFLSLVVLVLVSTLVHRIWIGILIITFFLLLSIVIRKFGKFQYLSLFLICPLVIISFLHGIVVYDIDLQYGIGSKPSLMELGLYLIASYGSSIGIISIFFPLGLLATLYYLFTNYRPLSKSNNFIMKVNKKNTFNLISYDISYYLILLMILLAFIVIKIEYSLVLFFPIIIIFSIKGFLFIYTLLNKIPKKIGEIFIMLFFGIILIYNLLRIEFQSIGNIQIISITSIVAFILFLIISFFKKVSKSNHIILKIKIKIKSQAIKKNIWLILFITLMINYSIITAEITRNSYINSELPWENRYITDEEYEVIFFLEQQKIEGFIFISEPYISERIGSYGFLPTISNETHMTKQVYFNLTTSNEIYKNTNLSLSQVNVFTFYNYSDMNPVILLFETISDLNLALKNDFLTLLSHKIQYILIPREIYKSDGVNNWILIKSLQYSKYIFSNQPVFETEHLVLWKIY